VIMVSETRCAQAAKLPRVANVVDDAEDQHRDTRHVEVSTPAIVACARNPGNGWTIANPRLIGESEVRMTDISSLSAAMRVR
jgi:hypothetical protein